MRHAAHWPAFALVVSIAMPAAAQTTTEREPGLHDATPRWHAIVGARLVVAPGRAVDDGVLVLKDGVVAAAGRGVAVPTGARVWNLRGRTVYAGFIDLAGTVGVPPSLQALPLPRPDEGPGSELPPPADKPPEPKPLAGRSLAASNPFVRAEQDIADQLVGKPDELRAQRALGFAAVLAVPGAGVFRGQSALVAMGDTADAKSLVIAPRVAQHMGFEIDRRSRPLYPASLMGSVALARQVLHDARWHRARSTERGATGERVARNASLEALAPVLDRRQPVIHALSDELDAARAVRLAGEFGHRLVLQGTGYEYRIVAQLKAAALPVIVPLTFPPAPDVRDPDAAIDATLHDLQHWEQAPSNLAHLDRAGVPFAVTAAGLKKPVKEFWPRLRRAVQRGLNADRALAALTTQPAAFIGESARLGTLEPGRIANVVVASGDLFREDDADVELVFVDGRPLANDGFARPDVRGTWSGAGIGEPLVVGGTRAQPKLARDGTGCELTRQGRSAWVLRLPCRKPAEAADAAQTTTIVAELRGDRLVGTAQTGSGPLRPWSAERAALPRARPASAAEPDVALPTAYPAGAYGVRAEPRPAEVLVRNATVWTQGPAGRIAGADVLVRDGRIAAVGTALRAGAGAMVIDATGKHVTPGLIDAHSHIALSKGWNEWTTEVSAEVRVADAIDPTDIAIYRIAAGGVTTALVLHGSANTIGGQSQVIKLRWGSDANGLLFDGAPATIKFALGENPKGSNYRPPNRYPSTRLGIEQLLRDTFAATRDYVRERAAWRARGAGAGEPRRDLRLEAVAEVLDGRRLVHIHSYRADEILMFARLAKEFDVPVAAFQHVLEGYKVADAIAGIGAGASSFSDWWGFKVEVQDGVPANPALLHRAGIVTSVHSDDSELARRMNLEAAKAVKYGGLSAEEALALVTTNPARQLRVERRVGSLESGKDADFVIWNGAPLSSYSRVEQTWIDGRRVFDVDADVQRRATDAAERARLVALALNARDAGPQDGESGGDDASGAAAMATIDAAGRVWLAWRALREHAQRSRPAYADADTWHECTEHSP